MPYREDKRIEFPVPFLKEDTVMYVPDDMGMFSVRWMENCRYAIVSLFRSAGKKLIFLPDLLSSLNSDLILYMFPGQDSHVVEEAVYRRLVDVIGTGGCPGFLYRQGGAVYFHAVAAATDDQVLRDIRDFTSFLTDIEVVMPCAECGDILFREEPVSEACEFERPLRKEARRMREKERKAKRPFFIDMLFSAESEAEREQVVLDPRVQAILKAWKTIERDFGITVEDLELLLGYQVKLSRLNITTANKLFLTDFDNQEVKMDDLTKALYFFYLRHPEGARLKELHEHEEEIVRIYSGITGRDDTKIIRKSVQNLLDPFGNNLNVSMSRIKKAFKDVVSDRVARFYYVSGSYGEIRNVGLDRDLVIWEY